MGGGGLGVHLVLCPVRLPLLSLDLGLARGGEVSLDVRLLRASAPVSSAPLGAAEREVAQSQWTSPACDASSVASPCSSQHAPRRDGSGGVLVDRSLSRSSRVSRSSDRGTRKDRRARPRSDSSRAVAWPSFSLSLRLPFVVERSRASEAVVFSVTVLPRAVAP